MPEDFPIILGYHQPILQPRLFYSFASLACCFALCVSTKIDTSVVNLFRAAMERLAFYFSQSYSTKITPAFQGNSTDDKGQGVFLTRWEAWALGDTNDCDAYGLNFMQLGRAELQHIFPVTFLHRMRWRQECPETSIGVLCKNLFHRHAGRQKIKNERNPNAGAANAGLAKTNIGINRNTLQQ